MVSTGFLEKKYFQSLCVEGSTQRNAQTAEDASELHSLCGTRREAMLLLRGENVERENEAKSI